MTEHQGLPMRRRVPAVISLSVGSMMLMIDAAITGVVLPSIAEILGVEGSYTMLVVTVYQLTLAMTLLPLAALGERIGFRRLFQLGLSLHAIAGLICLTVDTLPALIFVRFLQSLGAATALSISTATLRLTYPAHRLGSGLALNTMFNAGGTALAPVLGAFFVSELDWRWAFAGLLPLTLISLSFSRALPDTERHTRPFDIRGAMMCALTFGLLISGLEGMVHTDQHLIAGWVIGAGILSAWQLVKFEKRLAQPVLPVDLIAQRDLGLTALATFTGTLASMTLILSMPFRLQQGFGFSAGELGGLMVAYATASVIFSPLSGALSDRVQVPLMCTLGMIIASGALVTTGFIPENPSHFDIMWRLWLCGVGFGLFFSPNARYLVGAAPKARAAAAGSLFNTTRMTAMATSATLVAAVLGLGLGNGPVPAFIGAGLAAFTAAISAQGIVRKPREG